MLAAKHKKRRNDAFSVSNAAMFILKLNNDKRFTIWICTPLQKSMALLKRKLDYSLFFSQIECAMCKHVNLECFRSA
jgi:hypothetical protein